MKVGDRRLLFATAFLRALATGMVGVMLGIYLARLEMDARAMGIGLVPPRPRRGPRAGSTPGRRPHAQGISLVTPLFIGAGLKVLYDVLLYVSFRRLKPPEERESPA